MKICIPTSDGKLCRHFGHCDSFTFAEINPETKEILNIEERIPEEGISCGSASQISEQGVSKVLAGGMGGRPLMIFAQNGVEVVAGCPKKYFSSISQTLFKPMKMLVQEKDTIIITVTDIIKIKSVSQALLDLQTTSNSYRALIQTMIEKG